MQPAWPPSLWQTSGNLVNQTPTNQLMTAPTSQTVQNWKPRLVDKVVVLSVKRSQVQTEIVPPFLCMSLKSKVRSASQGTFCIGKAMFWTHGVIPILKTTKKFFLSMPRWSQWVQRSRRTYFFPLWRFFLLMLSYFTSHNSSPRRRQYAEVKIEKRKLFVSIGLPFLVQGTYKAHENASDLQVPGFISCWSFCHLCFISLSFLFSDSFACKHFWVRKLHSYLP